MGGENFRALDVVFCTISSYSSALQLDYHSSKPLSIRSLNDSIRNNLGEIEAFWVLGDRSDTSFSGISQD